METPETRGRKQGGSAKLLTFSKIPAQLPLPNPSLSLSLLRPVLF